MCESTTRGYCTVHYLGSSLGFLLSFVFLAVVYHKTRNVVHFQDNNCLLQSTKAYSATEKQRQRLILSIAGISVVFVAIPSLIMLLDEYTFLDINILVIGNSFPHMKMIS